MSVCVCKAICVCVTTTVVGVPLTIVVDVARIVVGAKTVWTTVEAGIVTGIVTNETIVSRDERASAKWNTQV